MATDPVTLDAETRRLLKLAISNRRRELLTDEDTQVLKQVGRPPQGHAPKLAATLRRKAAEERKFSRDEFDRAALELAEITAEYGLSISECEVLSFVILGLTNAEIAHARGVSVDTVKQQTKALIAKMGARNRCHVVTLTLFAGLLDRGMATAAAGA